MLDGGKLLALLPHVQDLLLHFDLAQAVSAIQQLQPCTTFAMAAGMPDRKF